jgi:hypothetical protein
MSIEKLLIAISLSSLLLGFVFYPGEGKPSFLERFLIGGLGALCATGIGVMVLAALVFLVWG